MKERGHTVTRLNRGVFRFANKIRSSIEKMNTEKRNYNHVNCTAISIFLWKRVGERRRWMSKFHSPKLDTIDMA